MQNLNEISDKYDELIVSAKKNRHRATVILRATQAVAQAISLEAISNNNYFNKKHEKPALTYWISLDLPEFLSPKHRAELGIQHVHINKAKNLLGNSIECAVIDLNDGLDPNLVATLVGTIVGGGVLWLLLPERDWADDGRDPYYDKIAPSGEWTLKQRDNSLPQDSTPARRCFNHFIRYSEDKLREFATAEPSYCLHLEVDSFKHQTQIETLKNKWSSETPNNNGQKQAATGVVEGFNPSKVQQAFTLNENQKKLRDQIIDTLTDSHKAFGLIVADRGRGKSTTLAALVIQLQALDRKVYISAPHKNHLQQLNSTVGLLSANKKLSEDADAQPVSISIDQLLEDENDLSLRCSKNSKRPPILLIDELSALPLSVVERFVARYPIIVGAATIGGYEGSGRGLLLKAIPRWQRQYTRGCYYYGTLESPMRWANHDPLETFIVDWLMLPSSLKLQQVEDVVEEPISTDDLANTQYRQVHSSALVDSVDRLRAVFQLLTLAHYQTRPSDLRFVMDAKEARIFVAEHKGQIVGVLIAVHEGGFCPVENKKLIQEVIHNRRRPQGNLAAQKLMAVEKDAIWGVEASLRVMRIAVKEGCRRARIASQLIATMESFMAEQASHAYRFWSSSYGDEEDVSKFWYSVGAKSKFLGPHRDKSSGLRNRIVVKRVAPNKS